MFESLNSIVEQCENSGGTKDFADVVIENEMRSSGTDCECVEEKMRAMWKAMLEAAHSYEDNLLSRSGLTGGDGGRFKKYASSQKTICGPFILNVITNALKMAESNACMKRIVASPTAGSCGVLPAVLVPLFEENKFEEDKIVKSLFVSAGIGQVIANRASISGAEGGCQAEIGSASAMAAGTLVYLYGGSARQIASAAGFSLQNLLGLVCDPVAGLVEIPCVKRNVVGAVNACSCADMALAGIEPRIPADEVIDAMRAVGIKMDSSLKETGLGGLAASPFAKKVAESFAVS